MKKNWLLLVLTLFSLSMGLSSCSDDDDQKSTEAGILSFKFDKDVVSENSLVFGEPEIKEGEIKVIVSSKATDIDLKKLTPTIEVSQGATLSPASGIAQDFTKDVVYTVTAQDGVSKKSYTVKTVSLEVSESIYGTYLGKILEVELNGLPLLDGKSIPEKIHLTQGENGKAHFELKDFSFEGIALGDIKLNEVDLWNAGARHEFHGKEKINLVVGECDTELTGSIDKKGNITWKVNVTIEEEDAILNVIVDFEGEKLAEDLSSEAEIIELVFEEDKAEENKLVVDIEQNENDYLIVVDAITTDSDLKKLVPTISISEKATITPESGVAQDFTKNVVYTVTSEDGIKTVKYTVKLKKRSPLFFDFEEWDVEGENSYSEYYKPTPFDLWATSNDGASLLYGTSKSFVVMETDKAKKGAKAAKIITVDTKPSLPLAGFMPRVTSGSLFLGEFKLNPSQQLKSTQFGVPYLYDEKPLKVKGYYKYTPGPVYYEVPEGGKKGNPEVVEGKVDECAIRVVLFEAKKDDEGKLIRLDGESINEKSNFVAYADFFSNGSKDYSEFELDLEYLKEYDASKEYCLTLIFSSSKDGDKFNGSPGSTLIVDAIEVVFDETVK